MPEKDFRRRMLPEEDLRKEVTEVNVDWLDQ
jgi:hypothetical protein